MLSNSQKTFVYFNYLKISLSEIASILDVKINHLDRFISDHTVGEMIDKFDALKNTLGISFV